MTNALNSVWGRLMADKVLIVGASGFLGNKLLTLFHTEFEVFGTYYSHNKEQINEKSHLKENISLDITDPEQVKDVIEKINPKIVILAAALADMDRCETDHDLAVRINIMGVENVVRNCQNRLLVYYSSDAIFDGIRGNYSEDDLPNPVNFYGETKLRSEQIVKTLPGYLILRTSFIYSDQPESPKFIPWLIRNLAQVKPVKVAQDLTTCPTFIDDLAYATLALLQKKCHGVYHVAGASALSCYDMALYIAQKWGFDTALIHPVKRTELPWKAARAEQATLNLDKLKAAGIIMSTFEKGMEKLWESHH